MSITGSSSIRRLKDVAVVMGLHELSPFGGRATSGRDGRWLERFAKMGQELELVIRGKHLVEAMLVLLRRRPRQGLAPFVSANGTYPFYPFAFYPFYRPFPRRGQAGFLEKKRARPRGRPGQPG